MNRSFKHWIHTNIPGTRTQREHSKPNFCVGISDVVENGWRILEDFLASFHQYIACKNAILWRAPTTSNPFYIFVDGGNCRPVERVL